MRKLRVLFFVMVFVLIFGGSGFATKIDIGPAGTVYDLGKGFWSSYTNEDDDDKKGETNQLSFYQSSDLFGGSYWGVTGVLAESQKLKKNEDKKKTYLNYYADGTFYLKEHLFGGRDNFFLTARVDTWVTMIEEDDDFVLSEMDMTGYLLNDPLSQFTITARGLLEDEDDFPPFPLWRIDDDNDLGGILYNVTLTSASAPVPEPATMLLLGAGLVGLAGIGRKKFIKK